MQVVGADHVPVGRVKQVGPDEFVLDRRPARRDLRVPRTAVRRVVGAWAVLDTPAADVDLMEPWGCPRIAD